MLQPEMMEQSEEAAYSARGAYWGLPYAPEQADVLHWHRDGDHWRYEEEGKPVVLRYARPRIAAIAAVLDDNDGPSFY